VENSSYCYNNVLVQYNNVIICEVKK
jgi:hypothetical protein